jgi:hypothetical protein
VLLCAADGTIVDFDLVAAKSGEREAALALLEANPIEAATIVCDKGFAGATSKPPSASGRRCCCVPAAPTSPTGPTPPIGWIRQQIESIVNSPKDQLRLERLDHHRLGLPSGMH